MLTDYQKSQQFLHDFKFHELFVEVMKWNRPQTNTTEDREVENIQYSCIPIAEVPGATVFEVLSPSGVVPTEDVRTQIYKAISNQENDNILIFINHDRTRSLWLWAKRVDDRLYPRIDSFVKGEPSALFAARILRLSDPSGNGETEAAAFSLESALGKKHEFDTEKLTKRFYQSFYKEHQELLGDIQGIDDEDDRRLYTSVILNRLMFVYFLQKKGFINQGDMHYLRKKLTESQQRGSDRFYSEFLNTLFFEGLAQLEQDRSPTTQQMLGEISYLGGLFFKHPIELNERCSVHISDQTFERIFDWLDSYSWYMDDRPGSKPDEITPDVLGYVFEKYINQNAIGAYYTRPEITEYLCDRTINKFILDRVNTVVAQLSHQLHEIQSFDSIDDMVMHMDVEVCRHLVMGDDAILRNLSLLDPACGSGAFLIAAMKTLINVYSKVVGVILTSSDPPLRAWLDEVIRNHPSLSFFIKKRIITDNLYGVDTMDKAVEIAKLRLFLALVSSAMAVDELEPLPNIDFNIMVGNSLIDLTRLEVKGSVSIQDDEFQQGGHLHLDAFNSYQEIVEERNHRVGLYKQQPFPQADIPEKQSLDHLRKRIYQLNRVAEERLNYILLAELLQQPKFQLEQVNLQGVIGKRELKIQDIQSLKPFHWTYHFNKIFDGQGGFDIIVSNPPWEILEFDQKAFFSQYVPSINKNIPQERKVVREKLLKDSEIAARYINHQNHYLLESTYYRMTEAFVYQPKNGKLNLYRLFLEKCFQLLRQKGECGVVIPSGIRNDFSASPLRKMLLEEAEIDSILTFSNDNFFFPGFHHSFKTCVLTFKKGNKTTLFKQALYGKESQEQLNELGDLLMHGKKVNMLASEVRLFSPDDLSFMELRDDFDIQILKKIMDKITLLDSSSDFHSVNQSYLILKDKDSVDDALPLYSGKKIKQFFVEVNEPAGWISESVGRAQLLDSLRSNEKLGYQEYRLAYRAIAHARNERCLISAILPKNSFCENSLSILDVDGEGNRHKVFSCAIVNSFSFDYVIRLNISGSYIRRSLVKETLFPPVNIGSEKYLSIVGLAAKLICTTPEFDDLAAEVGLGSAANGVTDPAERAQIQAELDGIIAHLYDLTEAEFTHILSTFPIVSEDTKQAALDEYRNLLPSGGDQVILRLIQQGESAQIEFKSTARWDLRENKKNLVMEEVILKTVAAFLNSDGGTLLIGVADDGTILGLQPDYQTLKKKDRDGFELWLMGDLLLKALGNDLAPYITIQFSTLEAKEICQVTLQPAPRPVYCDIKNKNGQPEECFYIRAGNQTKHITKLSEFMHYTQTRWGS